MCPLDKTVSHCLTLMIESSRLLPMQRATDHVEGDTRAGGKVTKELAIGLYHQDRGRWCAVAVVMLYHAGGAIKGAHAHTKHPDKGQGFTQSFGKPASRPLPTSTLRSA